MILALNSKRRQEILRDMGFNFKVITTDIEEVSDKKDISEMILDIAEKKIEKIANDNIDEFVLGADTVVSLDGKVFGKPRDREEAEKFLKILDAFMRLTRLNLQYLRRLLEVCPLIFYVY